ESCALIFVEAGFVPNGIQFITYSPAYRPCARHKSSEASSVGVPFGYRQFQDTFHGLIVHADQRDKVTLIFKGAGLKEAERLLAIVDRQFGQPSRLTNRLFVIRDCLLGL